MAVNLIQINLIYLHLFNLIYLLLTYSAGQASLELGGESTKSMHWYFEWVPSMLKMFELFPAGIFDWRDVDCKIINWSQ